MKNRDFIPRMRIATTLVQGCFLLLGLAVFFVAGCAPAGGTPPLEAARADAVQSTRAATSTQAKKSSPVVQATTVPDNSIATQSSFPLTTTAFIIPSVTQIRIPVDGGVHQIGLSSSEAKVFAATDYGILAYDTVTMTKPVMVAKGAVCLSMAYLHQADVLVAGNPDGKVQWWHVAKNRFLGAFDTRSMGVRYLMTDKDESVLVSGGDNGRVVAWSLSGYSAEKLPSSKPLFVDDSVQNRISGMAVSQVAAVGTFGKLLILDLKNGGVQNVFSHYAGWIRALAFTRDGSMLAAADGAWRIIFYKTSGWQFYRDEVLDVPGDITALAFHPENQMLAVGSERGSVQIWVFPAQVDENGSSRKPPIVKTTIWEHGGEVTDLKFNANGTMLFAAMADGDILIFPFRVVRSEKDD